MKDDSMDIVKLALIIIGIGWFWLMAAVYISNQHKNELDIKTKHYSCYLDGQEVDRSKVDINNYNYTIDDDLEVVYLTHKIESDDHRYIPPIIH